MWGAGVGAHPRRGAAASAGAPARLPARPGGNARFGCAGQAGQTPSAAACSQSFLVLEFPLVLGLGETQHRTRHHFRQIRLASC